MLKEPEIKHSSVENLIRIFSKEELIVYFGKVEPDISVCWVPIIEDDFEIAWDDFRQVINDLLIAGYPGCVDCAGPAATEPWDELLHRSNF